MLAPPSPSGTINSALSSFSDTVGACTRALGAATAAADEPGLEEEASPSASEEEAPIILNCGRPADLLTNQTV